MGERDAYGAARGEGEAAELRKERLLLWTLAAIQFTHVLDFMIVMPLGPRFMEVFSVTPSRFGFMVSVYSYSAGLAGVVAAWFIDRFDRKPALLLLYAGFALGTLACALAPSFSFLVAARLVTGAFGGVVSATVLAVIGDAIPPQRRGAAMGTVFTSFSLASIAGVPFGLFLANHLGWHAPFFLLAGLSTLILPVARAALPPLRGHLREGSRPRPWQEMRAILGEANHWRAFALTVVMTGAGFLIIPYLSPSLVANAGVANEDLPWVYLCGGSLTFFSLRWVGRLSDRVGHLKVFTLVSLVAIVPMLAVTVLPPLPLPVVLMVTTAFMIFSSGRMVPGMAMVTGTVTSRMRGGFMNLNSAFQQVASGLAAMIGGAILVQGPGGILERYVVVGLLGCACVLVSLLLARQLRSAQVAPASKSGPARGSGAGASRGNRSPST